MTPGPEKSPSTRRWRFGTPAVFVVCGVLFVVSAANSEGTDLRPNRNTDLASIVEAESDETTVLTARAAALNREVEQLTKGIDDIKVNRSNREIAVMEDPAGLTPRSGPAVTVTLTDAPIEVADDYSGNPNDLVVHQQDIQAVVNAMWRGGAEAVTVQGQRIVSTTGIKCSGNTVQLQGVPYSPPYVIRAIGLPSSLLASIAEDDTLELYREDSLDPEISVGWDVTLQEFATAPPYEGLLDLDYAVPLEG